MYVILQLKYLEAISMNFHNYYLTLNKFGFTLIEYIIKIVSVENIKCRYYIVYNYILKTVKNSTSVPNPSCGERCYIESHSKNSTGPRRRPLLKPVCV